MRDSGTKHVNEYRDGKALTRYLESQVGRPWNKVFHEICQWADARTKVGQDLRKRVKWNVETDSVRVDEEGTVYIKSWARDGTLYVHPTTGILCRWKETPRKRKFQVPSKIHWYGDVYFESMTVERSPKEGCRCTNFKYPDPPLSRNGYPYYIRWEEKDKKCIHGNNPVMETLWYVVEYAMHDADEIKEVIKYDPNWPGRNEHYNLCEGDKYIRYWGEFSDIERQYVKSRKSANHKELVALREILNSLEKSHRAA